jgi:hypothetical protein
MTSNDPQKTRVSGNEPPVEHPLIGHWLGRAPQLVRCAWADKR